MNNINEVFKNPENKYAYVVSEIGVNHDGCIKKALDLATKGVTAIERL